MTERQNLPKIDDRRSNSLGSALLLILGCVALMTILVISFFASARTEFSTSSFYAKGVNTKLLSENVINLVEAQLREGARSTDIVSGQAVAWASQPGMIRTYDNSGNPYKYFKLYSWDNMVGTGAFDETQAPEIPPTGWSAQPNIFTDLNEPANGLYPIIDPGAQNQVEGFSFTPGPDVTASSANQLPMPVKWLYVLKNGAILPATPVSGSTAVTITGAGANNPIIGRVAFWTDDETCKVNINTASEGSFFDAPIGQSTEEMGAQASSGGLGFVYPYGFMSSEPAALEFQRIPGHPAQTSLSTVFGYSLNQTSSPSALPDTSLDMWGPTYPLTSGTTGTYATTFGPYFSLTPRLQAGGSMNGAQPSAVGFNPPGYRLYDSIDELVLDPSRISLPTANGALYPAANGASPSGRSKVSITPAMIEQRRFFLTAHSRAPEETLFGTPRVSLWPLQTDTTARTAKDNLLAFCSTINNEPYYYQRASWYQYQQNASAGVVTNSSTPSSQSATADFPAAPTSTLAAPISATTGNIARNENIYAYLQAMTSATHPIPGFGGSLAAKYPGGTSGISDRDEILTEMFDVLRSGVNTFDVATSVYPHYNFTPFAVSGNLDLGAGTTVPISIPNGTHGIGRNYNIAEVSLVLTACGMDLAPNTSNSAGTLDPGSPNYVAGTSTTIPTLRRISIGPGLPYACEVDSPGFFSPSSAPSPFPGTLPQFLYWDYSQSPPPVPAPGSGTSQAPDTRRYGTYTSLGGSPPNLVVIDPTTGLPAKDAHGNNVPLPSTACTIGDPQTTQIQAFLIVRPFTAMPGPPYFRPNVRIRITHLDQLSVTTANGTTSPLGFPAASSAVAIINTQNNVSSTPEGGMTEAFLQPIPNNPNQGFAPWNNDGTKPTVNYNYPFVGIPVTIPTAYPSPYGGEDDPSTTDVYIPAGGGQPAYNPPAGSGVPPPPMAQVHQLATTSNTYVGSTLQVNGATLQIDVLDGYNSMSSFTPSGTTPPIQTVFVNIPTMKLPVPTIERTSPAGGGEPEGIGTRNGNAAGGSANIPRIPGYGGTPSGTPQSISYQVPSSTVPNPNPIITIPSLYYYWQMAIDPTGMMTSPTAGIANRFNCKYDTLTFINRGDIVRSFVVNPASQVAGDMRMLAANPIRTLANAAGSLVADDFAPLGMERSNAYYTAFPTQGPAYGSPASLFIRQLHSLLTDTGRTFGGALLQTSQTMLSEPGGILDLPFQNQGAGEGESAGALIQEPNLAAQSPPAVSDETYSSQSAPVVTPELNGAFMDPSTQKIPGDWTLGFGSTGDGGFVQKPDEGEQDPVSATAGEEYGYSGQYYTTNGNLDFSTTNISYAPNRQVPSAIIFGTLPSRVFGGLTASSSGGVPWCTLLFCPNPASNDNGLLNASRAHPGFGTTTAGAFGPETSPPYTTPPDYLFLDLFWMPIVEPYALSEPFSTAGKVNMNYEIVPFGSYINRSTALHAVLKSTRITAIASTFNDVGTPATNATATTTEGQGYFPSLKAVGPNRFSTPLNYGLPNFNYSIRYGINLAPTIDDFASPNNLTNFIYSAFYQRFKVLHDIFRSASEICNIFLVPQQIPQSATGGTHYPPVTVAPFPPTDASPPSMETWWKSFQLTGDNARENPYNQIYPRLTTKSNSFDVHMRVQVLTQSTADKISGTFNPGAGDSVTGEYRGSVLVERYLDPNQTTQSLPDFATSFPANPTDGSGTVDNYVRYRVVSTHAFSP